MGVGRGDWCILRTKGSSTLRLARSLELDGIGAWTPTEIQQRGNHRNSAKHEVMLAVMPTYVFAPAEHLVDLLAAAEAPVSIHPDFSVFRHLDRFPLIADVQLNSLRLIERKAAAKNSPVVFPRDYQVRIPDGPFQGLTGRVVEDSNGGFTLVAFPNFAIPIKFASWTLDRAA